MDKEFIPYEQALELKELGFDEPCYAGYYDVQDNVNLWFFKESKNSDRDEIVKEGFATAPLYQQAFRWFREKHGLFATIDGLEERLYYKITQTNEYSKEYNTYEETELACLNKLIELIKTKL